MNAVLVHHTVNSIANSSFLLMIAHLVLVETTVQVETSTALVLMEEDAVSILQIANEDTTVTLLTT
jgi:hypothetical protein